jgi:hypothetical protein
MPGYTHTCASCDAKLKIHERYVGRTLHCTRCGTEFLADPTLADVDDIIDDLLPAKERRPFPWIWVLAAAAVLIVAGLWVVQAHRAGYFAELFKPTRSAGQVAVLAMDDHGSVPAAMDRDTVVLIAAALEADDPGSLDAIRAKQRLLEVASGTKATVIEIQRSDRIARVRILTGPWASRVLWVPSVALR